MKRSIQNPYISVALKGEKLNGISFGLQETLKNQGVDCESASQSVHVSIAYTEGAASYQAIQAIAAEIAFEGFAVRASKFEILEGQASPYDYLVLSIDSDGAFKQAVEIVEGRLATRRFEGGFKSHVSLLKFRKGTLASEWAKALVRELNASQGAAFALGRWLHFEGESVCVFDPDRNCCIEVRCNKRSRRSGREFAA
jgi:hypothetical protein